MLGPANDEPKVETSIQIHVVLVVEPRNTGRTGATCEWRAESIKAVKSRKAGGFDSAHVDILPTPSLSTTTTLFSLLKYLYKLLLHVLGYDTTMTDRKIRQADGLLMEIHDPSKGPVLPVKGQRNILITSALPCEYSKA